MRYMVCLSVGSSHTGWRAVSLLINNNLTFRSISVCTFVSVFVSFSSKIHDESQTEGTRVSELRSAAFCVCSVFVSHCVELSATSAPKDNKMASVPYLNEAMQLWRISWVDTTTTVTLVWPNETVLSRKRPLVNCGTLKLRMKVREALRCSFRTAEVINHRGTANVLTCRIMSCVCCPDCLFSCCQKRKMSQFLTILVIFSWTDTFTWRNNDRRETFGRLRENVGAPQCVCSSHWWMSNISK